MQKAFEWYYFDIHTESGYDVIFTLHVKPFMSNFNISIFDFFVYQNNRQLYHYFFNHPQYEARVGSDHSRIYFDDRNIILSENNKILVRIEDKQISLQLELNILNKLARPIELNLLPVATDDRYFKWIVFAPLANATGQLQYKNEAIDLKGTAYHDYNTGNINLKKSLKRWYWGKFYQDDSIRVLGRITDRKGNQTQVSLYADSNKVDWQSEAVFEKLESGIKAKDFTFTETHKWKIDDIRFFVNSPKGSLGLLAARFWEAALFFLSTRTATKFLYRLFTNVRYYRYRVEGQDRKARPVISFYEEIDFL